MNRDAPFADVRRGRLAPGLRFTNPHSRRPLKVKQTFKRVGADDLNGRIGAHRGSLVNFLDDLPGHVGIGDIAARGIAANRKRLALIRRKTVHALAKIGQIRGLVFAQSLGVHIKRALPVSGRRDVRPFLRLLIQINGVAVFVGDHALRTLDRQNSLIRLLLSRVHIGFDLCKLFGQQRVSRALGLDLFQLGVIRGLEFLECLADLFHRVNGALDFVRHG